jgi:hypothetical protein
VISFRRYGSPRVRGMVLSSTNGPHVNAERMTWRVRGVGSEGITRRCGRHGLYISTAPGGMRQRTSARFLVIHHTALTSPMCFGCSKSQLLSSVVGRALRCATDPQLPQRAAPLAAR